jgi:hypothetical protein
VLVFEALKGLASTTQVPPDAISASKKCQGAFMIYDLGLPATDVLTAPVCLPDP